MSALRILRQTIPTGVVILSSIVVTMGMAQAQANTCLSVRGPKRAQSLSQNCSSGTNIQSVHGGQKSIGIPTPNIQNTDSLTPEQSVEIEEGGFGGGSLKPADKSKVLFRGPKRGGYID